MRTASRPEFAGSEEPSFSDEDASAVLAELNSILSGESFASSKRCSDFLRIVTTKTLAGQQTDLTERFLGVELYGRPVDYETATDAIVRVRANDVRRRLAEHYSANAPVSFICIQIATGSYIPEFRRVPYEPELANSSSSKEAQLDTEPVVIPAQSPRSMKWLPYVLGVGIALLAIGIFAYRQTRPWYSTSIVAKFWKPITDKKSLVSVCLGDSATFWLSTDMQKAIEENKPLGIVKPGEIIRTSSDSTSAGNIRASLSVMNLLEKNGTSSQLRWPQEIQETELDHSNVIYVGAFNNSWTMNLNRGLKYGFRRDDRSDGSTWMIVDRDSPNDYKWSNTRTYPQSIDRDFALITRIFDVDHDRIQISIGGLNQYGTQVAGEFITNETSMREFERRAPKDWAKRNLQIVLEMEISVRRAVNPKVVAVYVW